MPQVKRPDRDRAPCWICNEGRPKWLHKGTLLWCAATERIYAIGPECYRTHFGDRLDIALNLLRQTQQEKLNVERLYEALVGTHQQRAWIATHMAAAELVDHEHAELAKAAPTFRRSVSRQIKSSTLSVRGSEFLRGIWKLTEKLRQADKEWSQLSARTACADPLEWAGQLAPRQVDDRLRDVTRARTAMTFVVERLTAAADFTASDNVRALASWSRQAAVPFTAHNTAAQFEIRGDGEFWRGRANLPYPQPLPEMVIAPANERRPNPLSVER